MAENESGDGMNNPKGNGQGATTARGAATRGVNFVINPQGDAGGKGRNFTAEQYKQPMGPPDVDQASVPAGGRQLYADPQHPEAFTATKPQVPFKNMKQPSAPSRGGGGTVAPLGPESGGSQLPWPEAGSLPEEG